MHDVTPVPKVIDFGVAKAIGQQLTEQTLHTGLLQMVGHHQEADRSLCRVRLGELLEQQSRPTEAEQIYRVAFDDLTHLAWGQRFNALQHLTSLQMRPQRPEIAAETFTKFVAEVRVQTREPSGEMPYAPHLIAAELMRAEAAQEKLVPLDAAAIKLDMPVLPPHMRKYAVNTFNNVAWSMMRPTAFSFPRTAVAISERAAELTPDEFAFHRTLGIARYRALDYSGAATSITRALARKPDGSITGSLILAMALRKQGKTDEAHTWQAKAAELIQDQESVSEEIKQLEQEAKSLIEE